MNPVKVKPVPGKAVHIPVAEVNKVVVVVVVNEVEAEVILVVLVKGVVVQVIEVVVEAKN